MNDVDEGSAAMRGSVAGEPVAWAVWSPEWHEPLITFCGEAAVMHAAKHGQKATPLYIRQAGKVRIPSAPDDFEISEANGYAAAIEDFKKALDAAGIAWTE